MSTYTPSNNYSLGFGTASTGPLTPVIQNRAPTSTDISGNYGPYKLGQIWIDSTAGNSYQLVQQSASNGSLSSTWAVLGGSSSALATLTGDSGTATPSSGNIKLAGTAAEITTTAAGSTVTFSFPSLMTAPGSFATTTTLTGGTGITSTTGDIVATAGNLVASTAGTGLSLPVVTASGASPQTANGRVFSVTFTGVSIASGATQAFDIANTSIVGASTVALVEWSGATAGSALSIVSQVSSAGHLTITMTNGTSATMVTSTADITFTGIVLN